MLHPANLRHHGHGAVMYLVHATLAASWAWSAQGTMFQGHSIANLAIGENDAQKQRRARKPRRRPMRSTAPAGAAWR